MTIMKKRQISREKQEARNGVAFITPWIVGFFAFYVIPFIFAVYISFCNNTIEYKPVGFRNYIFLLTQSTRFWVSLRQTLLWTFSATLFTTIVAILFAALIFKKMRFQTTVRTIFYLPVVVNALAIATVVKYLTRENGWINGAIQALGGSIVDFWTTPSQVFTTILFAQVLSVGGTIVVYLAGLSNISPTYYEAAQIDGAGPIATFFTITLPMLSSVIYFNVITSVISIFGSMNIPLLYYGFEAKGSSNAYTGGPHDVVYHLGIFVYNEAFNNLKGGGRAAAAGIIMVLLSGLIVGTIYKVGQKFVFYES